MIGGARNGVVDAGRRHGTPPLPPLPGAPQGYLALKKPHSPRTLPQAYAQVTWGIVGGWAFFYGRGAPVYSEPHTLKPISTHSTLNPKL